MHIVLDGQLPTLNKYVNAERTNKFIAAKIKREATEGVAWQVKRLPEIETPADYTFTWYVANKRSDPDNIAFACKFIFDGLVVAGKLPNDSMKWVRSITHFFEIGEPKVEIEIEPC